MLIAVQELLDSPNEKDPANGPPNQMCTTTALRFHAVGPAELRSRLCRLPASLRLPGCRFVSVSDSACVVWQVRDEQVGVREEGEGDSR